MKRGWCFLARLIKSETTELDFSLDNFNEQKVYTGALALAHHIKNLLFMRPGDYPTIPEMGINIQSYRFKALDLLLSGSLKEHISRQISAYITNISVDNIQIDTSLWKGDYYLIITIVLVETETKVIYAVQQTKGEIINFNFKLYDNVQKPNVH